MEIKDIKNLANLARIDMSEDEMAGILKDFNPILEYVGHVKEALKLSDNISQDKNPQDYLLQNIMREDIVTNNSGEFTEKILADAPETENGFLKVKQIL